MKSLLVNGVGALNLKPYTPGSFLPSFPAKKRARLTTILGIPSPGEFAKWQAKMRKAWHTVYRKKMLPKPRDELGRALRRSRILALSIMMMMMVAARIVRMKRRNADTSEENTGYRHHFKTSAQSLGGPHATIYAHQCFHVTLGTLTPYTLHPKP